MPSLLYIISWFVVRTIQHCYYMLLWSREFSCPYYSREIVKNSSLLRRKISPVFLFVGLCSHMCIYHVNFGYFLCSRCWCELSHTSVWYSSFLQGVIKPDVVFFGENLPARFYSKSIAFDNTDLLLIMGTSLQVKPAFKLCGRAITLTS